MSKRLNKRQQRELEELAAIKSHQREILKEELSQSDGQSEEEQVADDAAGPSNAFAAKKTPAALVSEQDPEKAGTSSTIPRKGGKKKGAIKTSSPEEEMDDLDRALADISKKYGEPSSSTLQQRSNQTPSSSSIALRNLLSVDPKNLDADAELRRFFGSKVIASSASTGNKHRGPSVSTKLKFTLSKPKPQYPPATSLSGLGMREMTDDEVNDLYDRRDWGEPEDGGKWFTFEHSGAWREIERQFLGAVSSHDPNQLMALLQVYPWHVDTLLQMSEVYRLQSDIGAASDYAERALYAFDRCLIPGFSVSTGTSRLDFDRVENRALFTGIHRIISYLGRRGCWVTAFNFAKLLFSLDPFGDPHGAAFWLDFLAIKSGNREWLFSMSERTDIAAARNFQAYPGMAYAKALALREQENMSKNEDHTKSDEALRFAMQTFPQVIIPLFDKLSISLPPSARSQDLLSIHAGYEPHPSNPLHLLSHIYVSRSEALWKDSSHLSWLQTQLPLALKTIDGAEALLSRANALSCLQSPRDPVDQMTNTPTFICRHVLCSESTSFAGFLPPEITSMTILAYDPLPPSTAMTIYNAEYFNGIVARRRGRGVEGQDNMTRVNTLGAALAELVEAAMREGVNWRVALDGLFARFTEREEFQAMPQEARDAVVGHMAALGEQMARQRNQEGRMPGGFGQERDDETD
ncbi:hypothetical protein TREMEDRAFT_38605 [Tremella mesenterica DSM 1558]|uniref:uncharacterized protein n=1 Tax=Tremella mesenterica (strain ATCC 24925 / CBS 8224 / DSM 1558 / NBRC 9311 / NRRL Y-6157 / RJB 2259-6 / UBC 559-6) TaxID=578456 RepID=UPI0003F49046|nr:uncharacterized protein TREMEDRAFT_38605 [Tremella mesenterica DSM 1558]EIW69934.1 hypothetical protein TREMEDRAFT_38605 [Tremella mesenterica DSM 1558]